jgi:heme A synthase
MKSWFALVLAPSVALGAQSVMYALVTPSCASQSRVGLHAAAAVGLLVVLVLAVLAFGEGSLHRAEPGGPDSDHEDPRVGRRFLAILGTAAALFSALVILGMWFGLWVLSPCAPWP